MTILPTKRTASSSSEENKDGNQQNNNSDRSSRRRDDHSQIAALSDTPSGSRRSQFAYGASTSERKDRCLRKRYKESERPRDRERDREQKREARREQKRDRIAKREITNDSIHDPNTSSSNINSDVVEPACNSVENLISEDCTGFNSEDEYDDQRVLKDRHLTDEEWQSRDEFFSRCIANLGFEIKQMNEDGACLFRSIADQVYGDQELHLTVRTYCMDYIVKNKDYFAPYVTEDFDKYVARKRTWNVHGNHLEIQAMSEMYNRTIEVYCYQLEPINIFNGPNVINSNEPIRLSYHRMCHYNSISNPNNPSVGVGLGLPNYHTIDLDRRRFNDAVRASEELLIEQTMLEDKLKATDWEATNEAIEEQVARESYIQYFRDTERRLKAEGHSLASGSSSTITSTTTSSSRSPRRGSVSPKGCQSPKAPSSPKANHFTTLTTGVGSFSNDSNYENNLKAIPYVPTEQECAYEKLHNAEEVVTNSGVDYSVYSSAFASLGVKTTNIEQVAGPSTVQQNDIIGLQDWDQEIMARVLAESQQMYLDELKRKSKKLYGSPGPSTSSKF